MFDGIKIFHRTASGLVEIRNKTYELTQSERLVLIIIDGVTPWDGLRHKLKGLAEGRLESALQTLLKKKLVEERDFSSADLLSEQLDSGTVDHFLRQDPLDPVTITPIDLWSDGMDSAASRAMATERVGWNPTTRSPGINKVDIYLPLEPLPKAKNQQSHPLAQAQSPQMSVFMAESPVSGNGHKLRPRNDWPQWSYWVLFGGIIVTMLTVVLLSS